MSECVCVAPAGRRSRADKERHSAPSRPLAYTPAPPQCLEPQRDRAQNNTQTSRRRATWRIRPAPWLRPSMACCLYTKMPKLCLYPVQLSKYQTQISTSQISTSLGRYPVRVHISLALHELTSHASQNFAERGIILSRYTRPGGPSGSRQARARKLLAMFQRKPTRCPSCSGGPLPGQTTRNAMPLMGVFCPLTAGASCVNSCACKERHESGTLCACKH